MQVLPLLRRTFAQFPPRRTPPDRRAPACRRKQPSAARRPSVDFDLEAARAVLPILQRIWNIGEHDRDATTKRRGAGVWCSAATKPMASAAR